MHLFISPQFSFFPSTEVLVRTAKSHGVKVSQFIKNHSLDVNLNIDEPYAFYGENAFCEFLAQEYGCKLYSNSLDWIARVDKEFTRCDFEYATVREINNRPEIINRKFVRPADDYSFITGVPTRKIDAPPSTPALISDEIEWSNKFRFIIINGKIASRSCYKIQNIFDIPTIHSTELTDSKTRVNSVMFMNKVLAKYATAVSCVIDIGFTRENDLNWGVIGSYPIWSSHMYGSEPTAFIHGLFAACERAPIKK